MMPWPLILAGNLSTIFTGIGKTGIPGSTILGAVMLANLYPEARASVGVLLPLLIVADGLAVRLHHRETRWALVWRVLPGIVVGIGLGGFIIARVQGTPFSRLMGGLVLVLVILEQLRVRLGWHGLPHHPVYAALLGVAAGVTTTIGNMAGPVMTLYFLSLGLNKKGFMGSFAWLFLFINLLKVPIYLRLGLIHLGSLLESLYLLPGVLLGAWLGMIVFHRIPEKWFAIVVQILAVLAALRLLLA